ncbi:MAG: TolC family protein [Melioribacter sp.]|uniref:TolC family protein n=1 Tax=Melioribacter sp. TaxID=2052167 RepID=UPI003BE8F520
MRFTSVLILLLFTAIYSVSAQQAKDSLEVGRQKIKLNEAIETALKNNPNLAVYEYEIKSLDKQKIQAGLIPNPEANFEAENFLGGKELSGFKGSEFTLYASQLFELGGKRSSRIALAENEVNAAKGEFELRKIELISNVKETFFNLYRILKQIELQKKFIKLNEDIMSTIVKQVKAGKTSPAEESKVKVALINSRIELDRLQRESLSASSTLSSLLGTTAKRYEPVFDFYENIFSPPDREDVIAGLEEIPLIKIIETEKVLRAARLELEKSQAVPDLTVSGGVRYLRELNTHSFVAGISIPLPFFNRNQGNIQSAEVLLRQVDEIKKASKLLVISKINSSLNNLLSAFNNSTRLKNEIIPQSEKAYEITRQGYLQGRFAFIDLLDAQRTLFDAEAQYWLELADYYKSLIELENLTGKTFIK